MADLARIKRNVAKMASMNAPEADIDGYIASEGVTIDDVRNYRELQPMTDEQRAQAQQKAKEYREKVKPTTFSDKVSEFLVTNPVARQVGFGLQGISNASFNPAGYVARAAGIDTKPLEAQTAGERATELAGQYGFDAAAIVPTLGLAASAAPAVAPYVAPLVEGGVPLALTGSTGSALATGIINPESTVGRMATDILGGGLSAGLTRPKFTAPKQDVKTVKELTKSIGEDALNRDIAEAERTGRNLLEVGGDEVMQAAQQARQQSPEARKIITDTLESSIAEQPTRTRGVINEALGTKGKNATIAQVMENAKAEAQPIYKELEDIGDLAKYETRDLPILYHGSDIDNIVNFDKSKIKRGTGFWLSSSEDTAKNYGKKVYKGIPIENKTIDVNKNREEFIRLARQHNKDIPSDVSDNYVISESLSDKSFADFLKDRGYNGISMSYKNGGSDYMFFNPEDLKILSDSQTKESFSQLANAIKNNDVLADTISRVKRANSSLKNLPDTDFKVVNEARKALSQASMNRTELSGYEARQALNELDPILNNITGGKLAQANKLYSDAYQFERAADLGRDVFNSRKSPDDLKTAWNSLSSTEKQAAKIGLREEVMNKIGSATNETNALNRFLPENVREKITTIAGNKEGGRIIDEAEQAVKLRRNYNKLTSGSQTAEKQSLRDTLKGIRGFVRNPWETTVDALAKPFDTQRNIRMAEYLTENPASLKDAFNRVNIANRLNAERMPKRTPYLQSALRAIIEEK